MVFIDTEVYRDYFLLAAYNGTKTIFIEMFPGQLLDKKKVLALMENNTTSGFNSLSYDLPIISLALEGLNNEELKAFSDQIILSREPSWKLMRERNSETIRCNHVDLFPLLPKGTSLKGAGARLNAPTIRDLPLPPDAFIKPNERQILREYCENDLFLTARLYDFLKPQIDLRVDIGEVVGSDVRSRSNAQIASVILKKELEKSGVRLQRNPQITELPPYQPPAFLSFETEEINRRLDLLKEYIFTPRANGSLEIPSFLREPISIGEGSYVMGIGGLHSTEKSRLLEANDKYELLDLDVASFYPNLILQMRLCGRYGAPFLKIYSGMVDRRLKAKREGRKVEAEMLKIVVNSVFGLTGSAYSFLFAPDMMLAVTLTGQFALLMLIERLEKIGVMVASANTDGIVLYYPKSKEAVVQDEAFFWQTQTGLELEETRYKLVASRDVNNYVAIKLDGSAKRIGAFTEVLKTRVPLSKTPKFEIAYDAVVEYLQTGRPLEESVMACRDLSKFVAVQKVAGGAVWFGKEIGKTVRFYKSNSVSPEECIRYVKTGYKVSDSDGARPVQTFPSEFPEDVDFPFYIDYAKKVLKDAGKND